MFARSRVSGEPQRGSNRVLAKIVVATLAVLLSFAVRIAAQTPTGSIVGTVVDSQGLPVEGATVVLTNQGTNYSYTAVTSSNGAYLFSGIDAGHYSVEASKTGFKKMVVADIKLDAATQYSVPPMTLAVGGTTQEVTVQAGAEVVNTTSTEVTTTVEKQQINDLPILDRNVMGLLELEPGINQGFQSYNYSEGTEIAGGRPSFSNVTLDGINIQDNFLRENDLDFSPNLPFNSQAQEFTVVSQNAGVENGGGSSQVSVVTPQGTNAFHGEGDYYYRTNAWAANTWFNDADGVSKPSLVQSQGAGNIGGPIKKDKLFFYAYYELLRDRQQSQNLTTVLNPAIISALGGSSPTLPFTYQPYDQTTGNPSGPPQTVDLLAVENQNPTRNGVGNNPPPSPVFTVDPTMLALMQRMPTTPNSNSCGTCDGVNIFGYQLNARSNDTQDNVGTRIDYNLNATNTITGTFAWNRQVVDRPDIDTSFDTVPLVTNDDKVKFLSTAWRWSPGTTFTNQVRFGFDFGPAFFDTAQKFGSTILDNSSLAFTDPDPNFQPQGRDTRTWAWSDEADWVKGNHVIKFGTQIQRITIFTTNSGGILPTETLGFSSASPFVPQTNDFPAPSNASISQGDLTNATSILASVTGILNDVSQTLNATSQKSGYVADAPQNRNYRQNLIGFYGGDTWRIDPRLTFTYGLRWDYYSPVDERDGLVLLPVIPSGQTIQQTMLSDATVNFAGGPSARRLYNPYWKAFSPNIGLAWDPFGNGKTAIRAGFSMNRVNDDNFAAANNAAAGNTGLAVNAQTAALFAAPTSGDPNGITVSNPMGAQNVPIPAFGIPTSFQTNANNAVDANGGPGNAFPYIGALAGYGINPNLRPPYIEQWNLSVQRDIGWNTSLSVSYLGNHGVGLYRAVDLNQILLNGNGLNGAPANFLDAFNQARANGFASIAAGGQFDPTYGGIPAYFQQLPYDGLITFEPNTIYQGQVGALEQLDHEYLLDSGFNYPGGANEITNLFPNPYIMGGDLLENQAFSSYNAGVVELRRRFNQGLYFQANYVYSKVITNYPGSQSQFQPYLDNARPYLERARAPFDITNAFKTNFTYELPMGQGHRFLGNRSRALGLLVDGWQTGSFITWQSGAPFSILSQWATFNRSGSRSSNNTAFATQTHQQLGKDIGVSVSGSGIGNIKVYGISQSLISADGTGAPATPQLSCTPAVQGGFCNPQPGEVGNLPLYAFDGPAYFGMDLSAAKVFNLSERFKLTYRTEAFNVLNHNVFAMPDQVINSHSFGQTSFSISSARILQMSLRLTF